MAPENSTEQTASLLQGHEKPRLDEMDIEDRAGAVAALRVGNQEPTVSSRVKFTWLGLYFFFSLTLTIYNKFVLGKFHFPWLLTFLHASFASMGTFGMKTAGYFKPSHLGRRQHLIVIAFSVLFTINIAVSNLSLDLVSVPFYQTMRMLVPFFTVVISKLWLAKRYPLMTYLALVPIIIGSAMTTIGELSFTDAGFLLTILGVVLAAVKTIVSKQIMTGPLKLHPLETIMRMSPLAAVQAVICAVAAGEFSEFMTLVRAGEVRFAPDMIALVGNGVIAFLLNVSSFETNNVTDALTMTVCGNLKQCLTVALGIFLFDVKVDLLNGLGMFVTISGVFMYSKSELEEKLKRKRLQQDQQPK